MLPARVARGRGRTTVKPIPYPIDLAIESLRDIDLLILVGVPEPVAFFAYPGKPTRLVREGCEVLTLGGRGDDLASALEALAGELDATKPIVRVARTFPDDSLPQGQLTGDAVSAILARQLPEGAIVCNEGNITGRRFYGFSEQAPPHDFLSITGGSIGCSMPVGGRRGDRLPEPQGDHLRVRRQRPVHPAGTVDTGSRKPGRADCRPRQPRLCDPSRRVGESRCQRGRPQCNADDEPHRSCAGLGEARARAWVSRPHPSKVAKSFPTSLAPRSSAAGHF